MDELLGACGLFGPSADTARRVLEEAGLVNPRKRRVAATKLPAVQGVLDARLMPACPAQACQAEALALAGDRLVVSVRKPHCGICGGSNNEHAVRRMAAAMAAAGRTRLLILGGTPNMREQLGALLKGHPVEARFVLADDRRSEKSAADDARWADVIAVMVSTPVAHKTTNLYARYGPVSVPQRGIAALAAAVERRVRGSA